MLKNKVMPPPYPRGVPSTYTGPKYGTPGKKVIKYYKKKGYGSAKEAYAAAEFKGLSKEEQERILKESGLWKEPADDRFKDLTGSQQISLSLYERRGYDVMARGGMAFAYKGGKAIVIGKGGEILKGPAAAKYETAFATYKGWSGDITAGQRMEQVKKYGEAYRRERKKRKRGHLYSVGKIPEKGSTLKTYDQLTKGERGSLLYKEPGYKLGTGKPEEYYKFKYPAYGLGKLSPQEKAYYERRMAAGAANLESGAAKEFVKGMGRYTGITGLGKILYSRKLKKPYAKMDIQAGAYTLVKPKPKKPIIDIGQSKIFATDKPLISDPDVQVTLGYVGAGVAFSMLPAWVGGSAAIAGGAYGVTEAITKPSPTSLASGLISAGIFAGGAKGLTRVFKKPKIVSETAQKYVTKTMPEGKRVTALKAVYDVKVGSTKYKIEMPRGFETGKMVSSKLEVSKGYYSYIERAKGFTAQQVSYGFTLQKGKGITLGRDYFKMVVPRGKVAKGKKVDILWGKTYGKTREIAQVKGMKRYATGTYSELIGKRTTKIVTKKRVSPEEYKDYLVGKGKIAYKESFYPKEGELYYPGLEGVTWSLTKSEKISFRGKHLVETFILKDIYKSPVHTGKPGRPKLKKRPLLYTPKTREIALAHELIHTRQPSWLSFGDILPYRLRPTEIPAWGLMKSFAKKGFPIKTKATPKTLDVRKWKKPKPFAAEAGFMKEYAKIDDVTIHYARLTGIYGKQAFKLIKQISTPSLKSTDIKFTAQKSKFTDIKGHRGLTATVKTKLAMPATKAVTQARVGAQVFAKRLYVRKKAFTTMQRMKLAQRSKLTTAILTRKKTITSQSLKRVSIPKIKTKTGQVQKQYMINKLSFEQLPRQKLDVGQLKRTKTRKLTIQGLVLTGLTGRPPPPPPPLPPPPPPIFPPSSFDPYRYRKKRKLKPRGRMYKYTASIIPGQFNIYGKMPKFITGVGQRPLLRGI